MGSLVAAYSVAWVVLMIYVLTLASRQKRLLQRVAQLQLLDPEFASRPVPRREGHAD